MEKVALTSTGLKVSPFIAGTMRLGAWGAKLDTAGYESFIHGCLEVGMTTFDHADIYGGHTTEEEFGAVIKGQSSIRSSLQLITKCGIMYPSESRPQIGLKHYNTTKDHIVRSAERSLQNLQTDYIDLLLIHRPDYIQNPQEIASAFDQLKQEGKVLHFGVSNYTPSQWYVLNKYFPLETNQIEISITHLDPFTDGSLDMALLEECRPTAWSPLGGGELFGATKSERAQRILAVAEPLCNDLHCELDVLLYAWLRKHPAGIIPVLGTTKLSRIQRSIQALSIELTHEQWYSLWTASTGHKVP